MHRRHLLTALGVLTAGGCTNTYLESERTLKPTQSGQSGSGSLGMPTRRWTLACFVPRNFAIWGEGVERFANSCRELSGGSLDITVKGPTELIPSMDIFGAVRDGDVEMGHAASYFWDGLDPARLRACSCFTAVPFGMTAAGTCAWIQEGGGQALWEQLYEPFGLQPLVMGSTGVQAGGWFRKPLTRLEDLAGLTMRIPGLGGKVLARAGGNPQVIPGHEIYTALERGRIDATEWIGPFHDYQRGFFQVAPYYYVGGWHEPGSVLELLINKERWQELGVQGQWMVRAAAAEADSWMARRFLALDGEYYQKLLHEGKTRIAPYPLAIARALRVHAQAELDDIAASSELARTIISSYQAFQQVWQAWYRVSDANYLASLEDA